MRKLTKKMCNIVQFIRATHKTNIYLLCLLVFLWA